METHRTPPVLDMTPEGGFRQPPTPPRPGTLDRILGRVGGVALLVALAAGGLLLASLAVVFVGLILPVLLVAGLIGAGSLWWRMRRARQQGRPVFVVMRR
jgi:predicted lipid-binding transport protein (Tim44 family)